MTLLLLKRRPRTPLLALTLTIALLLALAAPLGDQAAAADDIRLVIDGQLVITEVPPLLVNGTTLVPIRVVSEYLGAAVDWSQAAQTVTITAPSTRVVLTVGKSSASVNGSSVSLSQAPRTLSGRTLVPLRFVSQALGAVVDWNQANRQVTISSGGTPIGPPTVEALSWQETPGVARFVIVTNGPVHYRVTTLSKNEQYPDRVLVDIDGARLNIAPVTPVGKAGVTQIRSFNQDMAGTNLARVVFDTEEPVRYTAWATWDPQPPLGLGDLPAEFGPGQQAIVVEVEYKVSGVEFIDDPGSERVVVHLTGPGDYRVWEASDPWRLVVDARRATLSKSLEALTNSERTVSVGKMGITKVRYSQFNIDPDIVRVVLDADYASAYNVAQEGSDIVIYLGGTLSITGFGYDRMDTGGRLTVWAGRPLKPKVTRLSNPDRLVVEFTGARLGGMISGGGTVSYGDDIVYDLTYADNPATNAATFTLNLRGPVGAEATSTSDGVVIDIGRSALAGKKIVLDPGHGGTDPGAIASNGIHEDSLTPKIANKLAQLLRAAGAEVYLTRTTEAENPDKYARPEFANSAGADVLVSIHLNANDRSAVSGSEVYYYHPESRPLAEMILSRLLEELLRPDGGVRWADFVVTREAHMPSCLVEGLYMTNPTDLALLMQQATLDQVALAIFEALEDYFARQPVP